MTTYGGDEISAIVIDVGSSLSKAGWSGEDSPEVIIPSYVGTVTEEENNMGGVENGVDTTLINGNPGNSINSSNKKKTKKYIGDSQINCWRENMELKNPLKNGLIEDWDTLEDLWDYIFSEGLMIDPSEHPLFISECSWNTRNIREKLTELAFEKYQVQAFYVAKNAVLSAFSSGRSTGLILDSGGGTTSAVPVVDGYVLKKGIIKQNFGGDFLSEQAVALIESIYNIKITPRYKIKKKNAVDAGQPADFIENDCPNTTPSFHQYAINQVMHEFKETICQVSENPFREGILNSRPLKCYEFPNGYNNSFGIERFKIPEIMIQPREFIIQTPNTKSIDTTNLLGIHELIYRSISLCDMDMRPNLFSNIVLTGGNTLFNGLMDRLNNELSILAPGVKIRIHASGNTSERRFGVWNGSSILSSLGTFHQLWISKKEYEEIGKSIVEKRCN
ncbi:Actin/actin-like protein [Neocallimastix lanati (nom. inval.)]|nr:Actin/actin-like protein [Neocallimastix sp. JGI-2020a]